MFRVRRYVRIAAAVLAVCLLVQCGSHSESVGTRTHRSKTTTFNYRADWAVQKAAGDTPSSSGLLIGNQYVKRLCPGAGGQGVTCSGVQTKPLRRSRFAAFLLWCGPTVPCAQRPRGKAIRLGGQRAYRTHISGASCRKNGFHHADRGVAWVGDTRKPSRRYLAIGCFRGPNIQQNRERIEAMLSTLRAR